MKKILLSCFIFISLQALAQKSFFGVDAGVNVANMRVVYNPPIFNSGPWFFKNVVKPTFGLFYQSNFSELFGMRLTAQYMGMGYQFGQRSGLSYAQPQVNINYLTFPLSFHYKPAKDLSLHGGAYLSFTLPYTTVKNPSNATVSITSVYHQNDNGFFIGVEHSLYKDFALAINYFIGTKNIWLNDNNGAVKYTNRALQFTLIYKFKKVS